MPTGGTTPKKKPAAKRGPTKAAALKALGLTNDDLAVLKSLKEGVEAARYFERPEPTPDPPEVSFAETDERLNRIDKDKAEGNFYARNLRAVEVAYRLDHHKKDDKRVSLKPRGERGDLVKLSKEDLEDAGFQSQVAYQLVEVITAGEATDIVAKQGVNQQSRVHPAFAQLRNELGQPYAQGAVTVEPEYNSQGVVVAHLQPTAERNRQSENPEGDVRRVNPGQTVVQNVGPNIVQVPGSGPNPMLSERQQEMARDEVVRNAGKGVDPLAPGAPSGPALGLGGIQRVTVEPTQRT